SIEKFIKIIKFILSPKIRHFLVNKHNVKTFTILSDSYYNLYNLQKFNKPYYSIKKIEFLFKSKYYIWSLIERDVSKTDKELDAINHSNVYSSLSKILMELSRWTEPLFFNTIANSKFKNNPNI